jgi:hypothetical protein
LLILENALTALNPFDAEIFFFLPPQKNTERDFHDNNRWASSALRFHQCREGKNKS